jgi:ribose transport system ATP-binding protein
MSDPISHPFLRLEGVTKRYGGVTALANVDFACSLGTIHAVVGENGAGKSSLMKIIAGVIRPDEGRISLDGTLVHFTSPAEAARHGIGCIFQELSLLPDLSVSDNGHVPGTFCAKSVARISIPRNALRTSLCHANRWSRLLRL